MRRDYRPSGAPLPSKNYGDSVLLVLLGVVIGIALCVAALAFVAGTLNETIGEMLGW